MLTKLRNRAQDEKGFTLIELLVVILIIGILAAIALPAFLNQRGKAQDTEAKSQVRTMQTAMETYYTDEHTYVGADLAALQAIEPSLTPPSATKGAQPTVSVAGTATTYTIKSTSETTNDFTIAKLATGSVDRACGAVSKFGCPSTGTW